LGPLDELGPELSSASPGCKYEFLHRGNLRKELGAANWFDWLQLAFATDSNRMSDLQIDQFEENE